MTEEKSRNLLENKLRAMTDADAPNFWIGPLVADSSSAFVYEGGVYANDEDPPEVCGFCAVNKQSGESGIILPPPGPAIEIDDLKNFKWKDWVILQ